MGAVCLYAAFSAIFHVSVLLAKRYLLRHKSSVFLNPFSDLSLHPQKPFAKDQGASTTGHLGVDIGHESRKFLPIIR